MIDSLTWPAMDSSHQQPAGPPPEQHGITPSLVLDVGKNAPRYALVAGVSSGVVGFAAVATAIAEAESSSIAGLVFTWIIGLTFLGIAVITAMNRKTVSRPRQLSLDADGVRWHDPQGIPWSVRWEELAGVAITRRNAHRSLVQLDLFPADPQFRHRHPEMEHLRQFRRVANGYRLSLGTAKTFTDMIDEWMRHFRPRMYTGIHDDNDARTRSLARWGDPTGSGGWLMTPETYRRSGTDTSGASTADRGVPNRQEPPRR